MRSSQLETLFRVAVLVVSLAIAGVLIASLTFTFLSLAQTIVTLPQRITNYLRDREAERLERGVDECLSNLEGKL